MAYYCTLFCFLFFFSIRTSYSEKTVRKNRHYLKIIIECLLFTAQQNIAQRGHEEDRSNLSAASDVNRGNFLELLHLRSKDFDWLAAELENNLKSHRQWTSPQIQNELIQIMSKQVLDGIGSVINNSCGGVSVIVDETSDIAKSEQVAICFRYVDSSDGTIQETFVGFHDTPSTTGQALCNLIQSVSQTLNIDLKKQLVGQCYDGASNMKGPYNGVQALMKKEAPKAIYVHCNGHLLNLAVKATLTNVLVMKKALGTIQELYKFIEGSTKRHALFKTISVEEEEDIIYSLKSQSATRWTCSYASVKAVKSELIPLVKCLIHMYDDPDPKTSFTSNALLQSMCDFQFLFGLEVLNTILSNTASLSGYLQSKDIDVVTARETAVATQTTLKKCRDDESFETIWKKTEMSATKMKAELSDSAVQFADAKLERLRVPSKRLQANVGEHPNHESTNITVQDQYRQNVYFPCFDSIITELEKRFGSDTLSKDQNLLCALHMIVVKATGTDEDFEIVSAHYGKDSEMLRVESKIFFDMVSSVSSDTSLCTVKDVLKFMFTMNIRDVLPHFHDVAHILGAIPATSCTAERAFSTLRRLKTYLRNTVGQDRLTSLAVLNIERVYCNKFVAENMDNIIDTFGTRPGRRQFFF